MRKYLVSLAGGDRETAASPHCRLDVAQFVGLAVLMLLTAIFAAVGMTYLIYVASGILEVSLVCGAFWLVFVLALDSYLIRTARASKEGVLRGLFRLLIRGFLAVIISVVVAGPLELLLFHDAIDQQLAMDTLLYSKQIDSDLQPKYSQIDVLTEANNQKATEIDRLHANVATLYQAAMDEGDGKRGTLRAGQGTMFNAKMARMELERQRAADQTKTLRGEILENERQLHDLRQARDHERKLLVQKKNATRGIIAQTRALWSLESSELAARFWGWFLRCFFMIIELIPILGKTLMRTPSVDLAIEKERDIARFSLEQDNRVRLRRSELAADAEVNLAENLAQGAQRALADDAVEAVQLHPQYALMVAQTSDGLLRAAQARMNAAVDGLAPAGGVEDPLVEVDKEFVNQIHDLISAKRHFDEKVDTMFAETAKENDK